MALTIGLEHAKVVTELPPKPKRKGGHGRAPSKQYVDLVNHLKENEGQWVNIGSAEKRLQAQALAFRIRKGKSAAFKPAGSFEASTRAAEDGESWTVFAKYVGVQESDVDQLAIDEVDEDVDDDDADESEEDWGDDD